MEHGDWSVTIILIHLYVLILLMMHLGTTATVLVESILWSVMVGVGGFTTDFLEAGKITITLSLWFPQCWYIYIPDSVHLFTQTTTLAIPVSAYSHFCHLCFRLCSRWSGCVYIVTLILLGELFVVFLGGLFSMSCRDDMWHFMPV